MIQNQHQYKVTNSKLKELEQSLASIADNPNGLSERLFKAEKAGLQVWIDRLKAEIAEYDRLRQGESVFAISSFAEMPTAIIKARIASGMTQKELAEKIGVKEQQIQRYEANHYGSASFDRLCEVVEALNISFKEKEVPIEIEPPPTVPTAAELGGTRSSGGFVEIVPISILKAAVGNSSNHCLDATISESRRAIASNLIPSGDYLGLYSQ